MSLKLGIIGMPNVGKSTLLNALTQSGVEASNYPFCTIEKNVGVVAIDDANLASLAAVLESKEIVPAAIEFVDIAGLVKGASQGEGLGNKFLGHIRDVDALAHVVRCFSDENITHVDGRLDPVADLEIVDTELLLSDLELLENLRGKREKQAKANPKEVAEDIKRFDRLISLIQSGIPLRRVDLSDEELLWTRQYALLSAKPLMVVANVNEDDPASCPWIAKLRQAIGPDVPLITTSARIEAELAELPAAERLSFIKDLGLEASGLQNLIQAGRHLLGLLTFYTIANNKLQAWLLPEGMTAPEAAGRIHSDMERGFIRMETMSVADLLAHGNRAALQKAGLLRVEGRSYVVREGDVCQVLFSV